MYIYIYVYIYIYINILIYWYINTLIYMPICRGFPSHIFFSPAFNKANGSRLSLIRDAATSGTILTRWSPVAIQPDVVRRSRWVRLSGGKSLLFVGEIPCCLVTFPVVCWWFFRSHVWYVGIMFGPRISRVLAKGHGFCQVESHPNLWNYWRNWINDQITKWYK